MKKVFLILNLKFKKVFIAFLAFCVFFTQTFYGVAMGTASAFSFVDGGEVFDLVTLVVEDSLMEDGGYFSGLVPQYSGKLSADTMEERIMRYAGDVQKNSPRTVVKTLTYKKGEDTLLGVINALENLYKNGDENVNSRLRGVVLIGDIPLPVVNKNGNRFISMFPLTDFDEKAYIYNPKTESFEADTGISLPKPEIWHGVLKAPQLDSDIAVSEQELNKLAEFFDKNHLYHSDVDEFSKFQRKLFFGDLLHEAKSVNEDLYKLYQNFLAHMDDLAYLRFNKYWAQTLSGSGLDDLKNDVANIPDKYSASKKAMSAALENSADPSAFENLPDLYSKDIILNYHKDYIDAVSKFLSLANDLSIHTGRYDPEKSGLDTVPSLISIKDTFTQQYLKNASDALENKVNEIAGELAEDVSIPDTTDVWGSVAGEPFEITFGGVDPDFPGQKNDFIVPSLAPFKTEDGLKFTFKNSYSADGKLYINGVSSEFLTTPKQCYPYLGTAYDPDSGEISVLTRSIRTDNVMSASQPYTLGINGFALPPDEALAKTNNEFDHGFIIEKNPLYGLPAFYNDSPLENAGVAAGDVILSIAPEYSVDAGKFGSPSGDFSTSNPLSECEVCKNNPSSPLCVLSDDEDVLAKNLCMPTVSFEQEKEEATVLVKSEGDIKNVVSGFAQSVGGKKKGGSDTENIYWDDESKLIVKYYDVSEKAEDKKVKTVDVIFNDLSPFSTLEMREYVYGISNGSYTGENQLNGCFFASGVLHDDRCFALTAKYPVLDPAGSYAPYTSSGSGVLYENNDGGFVYVKGGKEENYVNNLDVSEILYTHQFPIGKQVVETEVNDNGQTVVNDYSTHKEMFNLPAGRDFSEVDDIYLDACFNFLPEVDGEILPEAPSGSFGIQWSTADLYSWVTRKMAQYAMSKEGKKNQNLPYGGGGINVPVFDSANQFVLDGDATDPEDAKSSGYKYTLGYFAEHFGLYDGVDNDGNEVVDYKQDGDNFILDLSEADPAYGIDSDNVYQVGRFLLGKRYKWENPIYGGETVPDGEYWYPMVSDLAGAMNDPNYDTAFDPEVDVILKVKPDEFMKISSVILHNEPTNYTIAKQSEAGYSLSLPTDDPRYVAFMDANGDTQKLVYPSLFKSSETGQVQSFAQFEPEISVFAEKISLIPGAEDKLPKENGSVKEWIKKQLLSVTTESEEETFAKKNYINYMTKADGKILTDALKWNGLSVDDKHEYILQYYLNSAADYNPYVNDPGLGYETAYLVFEGGSADDSDYVEMGFNREPLTENDPSFNPYASYEELVGPDVDPATGYKENETEEEKKESPFVNLISFFTEEIPKTFEEFKNMKVGMKSACGEMCFAVGDSDECDDQVLESIEISPSKTGAFSDGVDYIEVNVIGLNSDDGVYTGSAEPELEIIISQDDLNPVFEIKDADKEKVLVDGNATYKLYTTKNPGTAEITVKAIMDDYEVPSEPVKIESTAKKIDLISSAGTIVAGEDSEITLSAKLIADDKLDTSSTGEVLFEITEGADSVQFVEGNVAKAVNGIAEVSIKPTTLAGLVKIKASTPKGMYYAPAEKEIAVIPSDAAKLQILSDTDTLVANGESKAHLKFKLYDEYNNLLSTSFEQLAAFVFGEAKLDEKNDLSKLIPGIEMVINEGAASIDLYSKEETGEANVYVVLLTSDLGNKLTESTYTKEDVDFEGAIGSSKKFSIISEANLQIIPEKLEINADGVSITKVTAKLTKTNGEVISGYEGPITWSISDSSLGTFEKEAPVTMNKGTAEITLVSTTKAGTLNLSVEAPGFAKNSVNITTLPGSPVKLVLTSDEKAIYTNSSVGTKLKAILLDQYDNVAYLSSAPIIFKATDETAKMIVFDGEVSSYATNGYGGITVKAKDKSGKVNLIVESAGLEQGILALDIKKKISNYSLDNFEKFSPKALYVNLLGSAFSDFEKDDLASALLYNGQTEAILSLTAAAEGKKQLVFVDGYGQIETLDENIITEVINADDSFGFMRVKFTDQISGDVVGQAFFVPKDGLELKLVEEEGADAGVAVAEGILVRKIANENVSLKFELSEDGKKIFIKNNAEVLASVDQYGRVSVSSKDIILQAPSKDSTEDKSYFSLLIGWRGILVGQIVYKQNSDSGVIVLQPTNKSTTFLPGVYLKLMKEGSKYGAMSGYSKYSTEFLKGAYIIDTEMELPATSRPGFGYTSVENSSVSDGVGLQYNNKNVLLFAAGNTAGEANIPYASDSGVLLGDPTIRIENAEEDLILNSGFTKDLGQAVFAGDSKINRIIPFDYNGDGLTDILLSLDDGRLRLLQNENSNERFVDRGYLLNVVNGIMSINALDVNGDNFDDLMIGTEESCVKGEKCLYLYKNMNGHFEREKLELNILNKNDKISDIQTGDLNKDGFDDAVILDSSGYVYVFWNNKGELDSNGLMLGNFGLSVDSNELIDDILVNYDGMPSKVKKTQKIKDKNGNETLDDGWIVDAVNNTNLFVSMGVQAGYTPANPETASDFENTKNPKEVMDFILTKYDSDLVGSVKAVSDTNGAPLAIGDTLKYTITLKNSGSSAIKNLTISDITPSAQTIVESSLACIDVNCPDNLTEKSWKVSDLTLRERVITGVSIPAKGKRNITYEAVVNSTPTASVNLGDFETDTEFADDYLDILVKPDEADSVQLNYFYSNGVDDEGRVIYQKSLETPEPEPAPTNPVLDEVKNIITDAYPEFEEDASKGFGEDNSDTVADSCNAKDDPNYDSNNEDYCNESFDVEPAPQPPASVKELMASTSEDSDLDGVPDPIDVVSGVVSKVADIAVAAVEKIGNAINSLRCGGQPCLPIPYNYAFLVPYQGVGGFAALAILPNPPYVSAFYPSTGNSVFRFYLSPTLTMGLGMAICPGTYPTMCFVGSIPLGKLDFMKKICKAIEDFIDNLLGQATKFISSATGNSTMLSNGEGESSPGSIEHNGSMGSEKTKMTFKDSVNIRVPGFPGVLTDWMDNQMDEIFNKLLDLPDFYVILPDFGSLFKQSKEAFKKFGDLKLSNVFDFLKILSQIPLIQIKGEEVVVKIPMINGDQITKYQKQAELMMTNIKEEFERAKQFWTCDKDSTSKTVCEKFSLKMTVFISNIQKLLDTIETYKELPKQILQLRTAETKYAQQIICYLDSITELIGGYIKRQSRVIKAWVTAVAEIINQFKGWKSLLNLNVDYQESCDQCKNERYGEIGILLNIFAGALPDIPIIPIPKWPNIIFDLSKLQLGVEILWPDIVFKPQPIKLPDLPTIKFPTSIPDINIDLDGLIPDFDLPSWLPESFEIDLPDLPPLPLPDLPDLPRPPKIPSLPKPVFDLTLVLKPILKILCFIKQGLFLFDESSNVKSEIEELTQPGVKPVLPITISLGMQFPEISYDAPVEWQTSLKMKFGVNTRAIYTAVKALADYINEKVEYYVGLINEYTNINTGVDLNKLAPALKEQLGIPPDWEKDTEKVKEKLNGDEESSAIYLAADNSFFVPDENPEIGEVNMDSAYFANIAELRNSLVSYVEGVENSNELLSKIENLDEFAVALTDTDEKLNLIASINDEIGDVSERTLEKSYEDVVKFPLLLADASEYGLDLSDSENLSTPSKVVPEGLYVYVAETKTTDDILGYTDELGDETALSYIDVENDGDEDLLFSFKGDLYLKKNYKTNNTSAPNFPAVEDSVSLSDYTDDGLASVQGFTSNAEKPESANVIFTPSKNDDIAGYEMVVFPSLLEMDKNIYNGVYRYFITNKPEEAFGLVTDVNGNGSTLEATERVIYNPTESFAFTEGDVLYAIEDSSFYVNSVVELKEGEFHVIKKDPNVDEASVLDGAIEVAKKNGEKKDQPLIKNMTFIAGDKIKTGSTGGVDIKFNNGAKISMNENEIFEILKLKNIESPNLELNLPNGNYYSVIYEISLSGEKSFVSTQTPIAPQICDDNDAPLPAVTNPNMSVAVTKVLPIDASASVDPSGKIKEYYIDLNLDVDSDGDGNPTNDPDLWSDLDTSDTSNDKSNPKFNVGPFEQEGVQKIALTLVDESGNASTQIININVFVPKLTLDPISLENPIISGDTDPSADDMPLSLMRKRYLPRLEDEKLKFVLSTNKIVTKSADENGQYKTLNDGSYLIEDASLDDMILVKDVNGTVVAEIDTITGNFWLKDGYSYKIQSAQPPSKSTRVDLLGLGTIYFVSKGNTEVDIHEDFEFTTESVKDLSGVHVSLDTSAVQDKFEFKNYPANDPNYPNGVYLYYKNEKKQMAAIDTAGNILLLDDRMSLSKKDNQYKFDPFVYELKFEGKKVAEIYVSTNGIFDEVQIVGPKDVPSKFPNGVTPQYLYEEKELNPYTGSPLNPSAPVFSDLSGDMYDYAINLYHQGVIFGDEKFDPNEPISRADFVILLLKMLCIVPRAEAYKDPTIFYDIPYSEKNLPFYYPYVKEAGLLGLIHGYGGEADASGMNPFKPDFTLSLAEAVQVILNGMDMIGAVKIDGIKANSGEAWYSPALMIAQNLAPFAEQGVTLKSEFIITNEDASKPDEPLTRGKALELAFRVLNAYNCLEIDKDSDGMMDYCEKKNGIDDPSADPDKDGLINKDECYYATDPNKYDTDDGGVGDGDEVSYGTNPLNKSDDQTDKDGDGLTDLEETKVYKTDPNNPDTDAGGVYDGDEVKNQTDPNYKNDDYLVGQEGVEKAAGQIFETEAGVYFVPPPCDTCPCPYTVEYKADLRKGDVLYTIIVNKDETKIYTKSNEEKVN